ncbi:hypothetical protein ACIBQX_28055 [Nonomuraea sp. NPDC049714]
MAFWAERLAIPSIGNPATLRRTASRSTAAARYGRPTTAGTPG